MRSTLALRLCCHEGLPPEDSPGALVTRDRARSRSSLAGARLASNALRPRLTEPLDARMESTARSEGVAGAEPLCQLAGSIGQELVLEAGRDQLRQPGGRELRAGERRGRDTEQVQAMPPVVLIQEVGNDDLRNPRPGCRGGGAGAAVVDHRGDPGEEASRGGGDRRRRRTRGAGHRPGRPSPWRGSPGIPPARRHRAAGAWFRRDPSPSCCRSPGTPEAVRPGGRTRAWGAGASRPSGAGSRPDPPAPERRRAPGASAASAARRGRSVTR